MVKAVEVVKASCFCNTICRQIHPHGRHSYKTHCYSGKEIAQEATQASEQGCQGKGSNAILSSVLAL